MQNPLVVSQIKDATIVAVMTADLRQEVLMNPIREEFAKLVDHRNCKCILLDMTRVRFAASRFLGLLAELAGKAKKINGWLAIYGLRADLRKPAEMIGLNKFYKFCATEDEAMAARPQAL